jgi:folate-binding protein YgfZ
MDPPHLSSTLQGLSQYLITEAVEFQEVTDRYRILPLHGPLAAGLLCEIWPSISLPTTPLQHREGPPQSGIRWIIRWDLFRIPGYHLCVGSEYEEGIRDRLFTTGLQPVGREAFEILRIESGVPWPGSEIDETVILNELGWDELVSYTKGCFVGQEIVARIKYRAHPPRLLKGFLIHDREIPAPQSPLVSTSKEVGLITSAGFSPTLNRPIALGFLKFGVSGTDLQVKTPHGTVPASVTDLPFV